MLSLGKDCNDDCFFVVILVNWWTLLHAHHSRHRKSTCHIVQLWRHIISQDNDVSPISVAWLGLPGGLPGGFFPGEEGEEGGGGGGQRGMSNSLRPTWTSRQGRGGGGRGARGWGWGGRGARGVRANQIVLAKSWKVALFKAKKLLLKLQKLLL